MTIYNFFRLDIKATEKSVFSVWLRREEETMVPSLGPWEGVPQDWATGPNVARLAARGHCTSKRRGLSSECQRHSPMFWGTLLIASRAKYLKHGWTKPEYGLLTPTLASLSWAPADMCVEDRVRIRQGEGLSSYSTYWWNSMLCCGHMPRLCRTAFRLVSMSFPPMSTVPDVGGSRPVRTDLPDTDVRGRKDGLRSALWWQPPPGSVRTLTVILAPASQLIWNYH